MKALLPTPVSPRTRILTSSIPSTRECRGFCGEAVG
jgi:hypothetical protein